MWRTQRSGTAGRTNRGFLAQCPPNPQVYPSHKTTRLGRRSCVLPQPAQATAISGSPFLFLLTVEILICDSSHEFSNRSTFFLRNLLQRRFLVSKNRCSFVSSFLYILALPLDVFRLAIVNRGWRQQAYAGMTVLVVVPPKKTLRESTTVLDAPKAVRELRPIFQGSELALGKGIVVRHVRPAMRFRDTQIGE